MAKTTSPRLSFKGYSFKKALYRNINEIKTIVTLLGTWTTYVSTTTGFDWKAFVAAVGIATSALVIKLFSDAVDFYFKDVEITS